MEKLCFKGLLRFSLLRSLWTLSLLNALRRVTDVPESGLEHGYRVNPTPETETSEFRPLNAHPYKALREWKEGYVLSPSILLISRDSRLILSQFSLDDPSLSSYTFKSDLQIVREVFLLLSNFRNCTEERILSIWED
jgi:hypothetical protein